MTILPTLKTITERCYGAFLSAKAALTRPGLLASKQNRYRLGIILDLLVFFLLCVLNAKPASNLITPLAARLHPFQVLSDNNLSYEKFSFIPGWAANKFDAVNLQNMAILSYYDIPVNPDGTLNEDTAGYANISNGNASSLFQNAHAHNIKVLLTLSETDQSEIQQFLDTQSAWNTLANQAEEQIPSSGVDGVAVDFELTTPVDQKYRNEFSAFVTYLSETIHSKIPTATVAVVLSDTAMNNKFYDVAALTKASDKLLIMAYDYAAPEVQGASVIAPLNGYNPNDYWKTVDTAINTFHPAIPSEKMVVEVAWYGNGDSYPSSDSTVANSQTLPSSLNILKTPLSNDTIASLISVVPGGAKNAARKNLPLIASALSGESILNINVLAYALATIQHETAGTFEPIAEFTGQKDARRLGYEGGTNYYGRGFIQLTHLRNYKKVGERIGMGDQLVENPDLAMRPDTAAKILAAFFKDNGIATLATRGDFVDARTAINPDAQGQRIAMLARQYTYEAIY